VTDNQKKCYDVKAVIGSFVDKDSFMDVQAGFARDAVVGFARLDGRTIGCVANQPNWMSGVLDIDASDKIARFVRSCDCFNIPLVTFVDVPGYMPGKTQESGGIIRHGAKILYAYSEAKVPKITVILRKAYGGAYIAMCSKGLGADIVYAWPTAEIAVMGAEGAVNIVAKKTIEVSADPATERQRQIEAYETQYLNPYIAASRGYVDEVIMPEEMRGRIVSALEMLSDKKAAGKNISHGNIPL
jgi:propionyl-CoA carboxylase beta chain